MPAPQQFITRQPVEIFGRYPGYGFAGLGVSTAIGNFTQTTCDLRFPGGLLGLLDWQRTYNSHSGAIGALGPGWTTSFSASLVVTPAQGGLLHHTAASVTFNDEDGRILTFAPDGTGGFTSPQDLLASLTQDADGSFALTFNSGAVWSFGSTGQLTGRSMEGQQVSLDYDSGGLLERASHSAGRSLTFTYDSNRRLTAVTSSDGRAVAFGYSSGTVTDALLESVTLPGGGVAGFESSGTGQASQISRISDPDGNLIVANTYDTESSRVMNQAFAGGGSAAFGYNDATGATSVTLSPGARQLSYQADTNGRLVKATDPNGNVATFGFDTDGRLIAWQTPLGSQLSQTWDPAGNLLSSTWGGATTTWTYDAQNRPVTVTDPLGESAEYAYEGSSNVPSRITEANGGVTLFTVANGLITSRTDADGGVTSYSYDSSGDLVEVTSADGEITRYTHDAAGNMTQRMLPSGRAATYTYDAAGRMISVTDGAGATTSYRYSSAGLLLAITDPAGGVTALTYNAAGQRTALIDPLGRTTAFGYDEAGNLTSVTAADGSVTQAEYDPLGNLLSVTDAIEATTLFTFDADGRTVSEETPAGLTRYAWDARGNRTSVTGPTGATFTFGYDLADRLTSVTGPDGAVTLTTYDSVGDAVAAANQLGAVTRSQWSLAGKLTTVIDPLGRTTTYAYDAQGRTTQVTNPEGGVTRYVYDGDGRKISVTTPAGLTTRYGYDAVGRVITITDPRNWITRIEYSPRGEKIAMIAPSGAIQRWRYDAAGQVVAIVDPNGATTEFTYDAAGHLASIIDAKNAVTRFTYDAAGRQVTSTDPLGRVTERAYDQAGKLIAVTDPAGNTVTMEYDAAGQLTRRSGPDGSFAEYAYDQNQRRTSMTDMTGITRYTYDAVGRLLSVTDPVGEAFTLQYDAAGQRTSLNYPSGLDISYAYDQNGRLTGITDSRAGAVVCALDPDGRLLTEELPGRLARRYHYENGLLHRFRTIRDGHPIATATFARDPDGRILTQDDGQRIEEFRYDAAGQLRYAGPPGEDSHNRNAMHFAYDAVGNRTLARHGNLETRYEYDAADQLLAVHVGDRRAEFRYDPSGRLISEDDGRYRRTIRYDSFGLPAEITRTSPEESEHLQATVNGDGLITALRIASARGHDGAERTAVVRYQWAAGGRVPQILSQQADPVPEDDGGEGARPFDADFSYAYGRVFASNEHEHAAFHHNAFGSALSTEATRHWVEAPAYDVFGVAEGGEHDDAPRPPRFGYRGELTIGSSVYLRARLYDPRLGRFTSRDPVKTLTGPAQAGNPYAYARNDPIAFIDPSGKMIVPVPGSGNPQQFFSSPAIGCDEVCRRRVNTLRPHKKCFQGAACLGTRGYIYPRGALYHNLGALYSLITNGQPERAAQAETIHQLDWDREGAAQSFLKWIEGRSYNTPVSYNVDWEVRDPGFNPENRTDIVTEAERLFEVKVYQGESRTRLIVAAQLEDYIQHFLFRYGILFEPSTELEGWGEALNFATWFSGPLAAGPGGYIGSELTMYIWGLGNLAGHIYFSLNEGEVPDKVKLQVTVPPPFVVTLGGGSPVNVQVPGEQGKSGANDPDPDPEPAPPLPVGAGVSA